MYDVRKVEKRVVFLPDMRDYSTGSSKFLSLVNNSGSVPSMELRSLPAEYSDKNFTMKMEAVVSYETSITRELSTRHHIPENSVN